MLAPNAKLRGKIVPAPPEHATEPPTDHARARGETPRISWARLLKRVFDIDIERCPICGSALKIIAAIKDPPLFRAPPDRPSPEPPGTTSRFSSGGKAIDTSPGPAIRLLA